MDDLVSPVIRGEFVYRDILLVDVGGQHKLHPRASEGEIKSYLDGKVGTDQVAHWYEAQLIHYGLQRSKDKNAAKVRLQQALSQKKLKSAPPYILDMEASMRRQYVSAVRKSKSRNGTASEPMSQTAEAPEKHSRGEEDGSTSHKKSKISLQVGDVSISIDQSSSSASREQNTSFEQNEARKAQTPAKKVAMCSERSNTSGFSKQPCSPAGTQYHAPGNAQTGSMLSRLGIATPQSSDEAVFAERRPRPYQTTNSSLPNRGPPARPAHHSPPMFNQYAESTDGLPTGNHDRSSMHNETPLQGARKSYAGDRRSQPRPVKHEPCEAFHDYNEYAYQYEAAYDGSYEEHYHDYGATYHASHGYQAPEPHQDVASDMVITGMYDIDSAQLASDNLHLFVCVDEENNRIWGAFELGVKYGTIKIDSIDFNNPVSFGWRARDHNFAGNLKFGKGCFGELEFFGTDQVKGVFHNFFQQTVYFEGWRRPGPAWSGKSAEQYEWDWNEYPREAYGR